METSEGTQAVLKVFNCGIGFQGFESVLIFAKMYIKYWNSMAIPYYTIRLFKFCSSLLMTVLWCFCTLCSMN